MTTTESKALTFKSTLGLGIKWRQFTSLMPHDWQLNIVCQRPLANCLDRNATFCKDHTKQKMGRRKMVVFLEANRQNIADIWESQSRRLTCKEFEVQRGCHVTVSMLILCIVTTEAKESQSYPDMQLSNFWTGEVPFPACGNGPDSPQSAVSPVWTLVLVCAGNTHVLLCTYMYLWHSSISRPLGERLSRFKSVTPPSPGNIPCSSLHMISSQENFPYISEHHTGACALLGKSLKAGTSVNKKSQRMRQQKQFFPGNNHVKVYRRL